MRTLKPWITVVAFLALTLPARGQEEKKYRIIVFGAHPDDCELEVVPPIVSVPVVLVTRRPTAS